MFVKTILTLIALLVAIASAQFYGPGMMMGGYGRPMYGGYGRGMYGGYGRGMYGGYGSGMYGGMGMFGRK
uniref:Neuropeptide-like protein 31 n=1 Tax=Parastrongyloides trichosuri TaxID=131310 RepID=A0A0N4ZD28_PARTI